MGFEDMYAHLKEDFNEDPGEDVSKQQKDGIVFKIERKTYRIVVDTPLKTHTLEKDGKPIAQVGFEGSDPKIMDSVSAATALLELSFAYFDCHESHPEKEEFEAGYE